MDKFKLVSEHKPTGDQPQAIDGLVEGIEDGLRFQTLLGVTGSGKTFTMANVINRINIIILNAQMACHLAFCGYNIAFIYKFAILIHIKENKSTVL